MPQGLIRQSHSEQPTQGPGAPELNGLQVRQLAVMRIEVPGHGDSLPGNFVVCETQRYTATGSGER